MTDYCTLWPEGWWSHCCAAHDADYLDQIGRALADERLLACVANSAPDDIPLLAAASAVVACVMWAGVRFFGARFYRRT